MHVAKSPITLLAEALEQREELKGRCKVLAGVDALARSSAPPRIVLFPTVGTYVAPTDVETITDLTQQLTAHVWGVSLDDVWDLQVRLFRALNSHATGGGPWWKPQSITWEDKPDTSNQGLACEVDFQVRFAIDPADFTEGRVDGVTYDQES